MTCDVIFIEAVLVIIVFVYTCGKGFAFFLCNTLQKQATIS